MKQSAHIASVLGGLQKYELEDIGSIFGAQLPPRLKKAEMIDSLAYYLVTKPEKWLPNMLERDLRLLQRLVHAGPGVSDFLYVPDYPPVVETAGLVDYSDEDQDWHEVWLREEIYDIVAPHIDRAVAEGTRTGRFEIERTCLGYLNLYGVMPYQLLLDKMMDYCDGAFGPDNDLLTEYFRRSALLKLCRFEDEADGADWVCSPCIVEVEEILRSRPYYREVKDYPAFSPADALEAGSGAPFFTFGLKTAEGRALVEMLRELGYEGESLVVAEHDIWMDAQVVDEMADAEALFEVVTQHADAIGSFERYNECLQVIADYANTLPKWLLNGYSPDQTGYLKIVLRVDPAVENNPAYTDGTPRWSMPYPTVSEGYTDLIEKDAQLEKLSSMLPEGFPFGMAIPHVAPEDPCPCGSGLQYRHCHGKIMN